MTYLFNRCTLELWQNFNFVLCLKSFINLGMLIWFIPNLPFRALYTYIPTSGQAYTPLTTFWIALLFHRLKGNFGGSGVLVWLYKSSVFINICCSLTVYLTIYVSCNQCVSFLRLINNALLKWMHFILVISTVAKLQCFGMYYINLVRLKALIS